MKKNSIYILIVLLSMVKLAAQSQTTGVVKQSDKNNHQSKITAYEYKSFDFEDSLYRLVFEVLIKDSVLLTISPVEYQQFSMSSLEQYLNPKNAKMTKKCRVIDMVKLRLSPFPKGTAVLIKYKFKNNKIARDFFWEACKSMDNEDRSYQTRAFLYHIYNPSDNFFFQLIVGSPDDSILFSNLLETYFKPFFITYSAL